MSNLASDPSVLLVAELIEKKVKFQEEQKELTAIVQQRRNERAEMRETYQEELVASQIAANSAASHRETREAKVVACTLSSTLSTLRDEIQETRKGGDEQLAELSEEAESLRANLARQDAQLKRLREASAAQSARVAASAANEAGNSDALVASLRADVERLATVTAEFRAARDNSIQQADTLRSSHDETQQMAVEADVIRVAQEAALQQEVRDKKAEFDKVCVHLGNAKEHCLQLRADCRSRIQGEYANRIARNASREQGCQTRRVQEDVRLREQVRDLSEQIEELKQGQADRTPWWSLCLRGSDPSGGAVGAAGAGTPALQAAPAQPAAGLGQQRGRSSSDASRPLVL